MEPLMSSIKGAFLAYHKFRALIGVRILVEDKEIGRGEWILIEINPALTARDH